MARARRRTLRRSARPSIGVPAWVYVVGALLAVGIIASAALYQNRTEQEMAVDATTLCPTKTGPLGMTAILFDLTDPLSTAQGGQLRQYIEKEIADAAVGTQFTLGVVSQDASAWGASDALCKPRSGRDVSALTQNTRMVERRYEERFLRPLNSNLESMISATGADRSPIMESLQALVADTPGFLTFDGPRRVIVVSDLLQHSDVMSFYRGEDWQSFSGSQEFQRLSRSLSDVDVAVFQVPRLIDKIKDPASVEDFWVRYFDLQGARLPSFKRLGDL